MHDLLLVLLLGGIVAIPCLSCHQHTPSILLLCTRSGVEKAPDHRGWSQIAFCRRHCLYDIVVTRVLFFSSPLSYPQKVTRRVWPPLSVCSVQL